MHEGKSFWRHILGKPESVYISKYWLYSRFLPFWNFYVFWSLSQTLPKQTLIILQANFEHALLFDDCLIIYQFGESTLWPHACSLRDFPHMAWLAAMCEMIMWKHYQGISACLNTVCFRLRTLALQCIPGLWREVWALILKCSQNLICEMELSTQLFLPLAASWDCLFSFWNKNLCLWVLFCLNFWSSNWYFLQRDPKLYVIYVPVCVFHKI